MKKIILLLSFFISLHATAQTWTNPLTLQGEWYLYGVGDPYILKHRGTYYLYVSTKDNNTGIKCWSTKDFKTWSNAITCSTDPITKGAYAPEVFYWNGSFYMYTSPAGNGHYVLKSDSPAGPFVPVTGNIGKSIDGSVFLNDDGKLYFYHADGNGIMGCAMSSPINIGADVNLNARMANNWTEGPCVFKRNGVYYLIYTGNHVISKGYRIDYAKNTSGPINTFTPQAAQNPILLSSEGSFVGLGHGSAFVGPDLDSYYFTYHNLAGDYGVGPYRRLNFDRIAWNGDKMLLLGPTTWAQEGMKQADMADFFNRGSIGSDWEMPNGGDWGITSSDFMYQNNYSESTETIYKTIYKTPTQASYTAEFTVRESQRSGTSARIGAVFNYIDEQNYGIAVIRTGNNQLEINFLKNNTWGTPKLYALPAGYLHNVWHTIRIEKARDIHKFFVDGMLKATLTEASEGGRIGYMSDRSQANFSYIAFSNKVNGSGIFDIYKPVPGTIEAVHYNEGGEGVGYSDISTGNSGGKYIRNDNADIRDCPEGGHAITDNQTGEWYKYNINVKSTGVYNVGIRYSATSTGQIRILQGDADLTGVITLPATGGTNVWLTYTIKNLNLDAGYQTLKVEVVSGGFDLYTLQFKEADNTGITVTDNFNTSFSSKWNYNDGTWAVQNGKAVVSGYSKRTLGNTTWSDYSIQTEVTYKDVFNAGLIFRVNNPALGGAGNNSQLGTDYYQGYFVTLAANGIVLGKQNYNWTHLTTASGSYALNTTYTIRVDVNGANIKVFVNDMNNPKIDFTDPNPFISGKVGYRSHNCNAEFDNFSVTTKAEPPTALGEHSKDELRLFPNPVKNHLNVDGLSTNSELSVFDIRGVAVLKKKSENSVCQIELSEINAGIYFLKIHNPENGTVIRKFLKE